MNEMIQKLLKYSFDGVKWDELTKSEKEIIQTEENFKKLIKWINNE